MKRVVIFGSNHHNTLGVIRSLGRKGISPEVLLHDPLPVEKCNILRSRYIKSWNKVESWEAGAEYLLSTKGDQDKPVVICTADGAASAIDKLYNELKEYYHVSNCGHQGALTELMNKEVMAQVAEECGLSCPQTIVVDSTSNFDASGIKYPVITKPLLSIEGSKAEIVVCKNATELQHFLDLHKEGRFQIQQFINKDFEYQLIGCSLAGGEHVVIPGRSRIITQPICTNTGYLHYESLDGLEPIKECQQFLKKINFSGLFSLEFLRDNNGNDYFMEINFRNDGNAISVVEAGVNIHYIWYSFFAGENWQPESKKHIRELYVMPEYTELFLWVYDYIGIKRLIRELKMTDVYMDYAKDDPSPTNGKRDFIKCLIISFIKKPLLFVRDLFR